jgi:hypothetical protein
MTELHPLGNFRTTLEAEVVAGLLREAKIPYLIQSGEGTGVVPMCGGATILVRTLDLVDAAKVLGFPRLA